VHLLKKKSANGIGKADVQITRFKEEQAPPFKHEKGGTEGDGLNGVSSQGSSRTETEKQEKKEKKKAAGVERKKKKPD